MNNKVLKSMVGALQKQQSDFQNRIAKAKGVPLATIIELTHDWGLKRINSILREAERHSIELIDANDQYVYARQNEVEFKGYIQYETRGYSWRTSKWTRPRMTLRLWLAKEQNTYREPAIAIIFGRHRLMTYNRILASLVTNI